jgi:phosphate transport system permease protein
MGEPSAAASARTSARAPYEGAGEQETRSARAPRPGRWWHGALELGIRLCALTSVAAIALIFAFIAREALPLFWEDDGEALRDLLLPRRWEGYDEAVFVWQPNGPVPKMNLVPLFVGTLKVTTIAMIVSAPLGIGAAIFVSQYAPRAVREIVKPAIELLAGVPSVVLGFFALSVLATGVQEALGLLYRLNALVAGLGLSVAVVPVIFTVSEDALQAVPRQLREASLALGARQWQTTLRVVLPAAMPGLVAALVLGFGRAIGETMVVLMASGNAAVMAPLDPTSSARTVTATIASELGEVSQGDPHWRVLFLLGALLFLVTFVLNRVGIAVAARIHRSLTAGPR